MFHLYPGVHARRGRRPGSTRRIDHLWPLGEGRRRRESPSAGRDQAAPCWGKYLNQFLSATPRSGLARESRLLKPGRRSIPCVAARRLGVERGIDRRSTGRGRSSFVCWRSSDGMKTGHALKTLGRLKRGDAESGASRSGRAMAPASAFPLTISGGRFGGPDSLMLLNKKQRVRGLRTTMGNTAGFLHHRKRSREADRRRIWAAGQKRQPTTKTTTGQGPCLI